MGADAAQHDRQRTAQIPKPDPLVLHTKNPRERKELVAMTTVQQGFERIHADSYPLIPWAADPAALKKIKATDLKSTRD